LRRSRTSSGRTSKASWRASTSAPSAAARAAGRVAAVHSFFLFLEDAGHRIGNPAANLVPRQREWNQLRYLTEREYKQFLDAVRYEPRDAAIIELLLQTGLRLSEVGALSLGDEAGHGDVIGWAHEMRAWYALTQGDYRGAIQAASAGEEAAPSHGVDVQLLAQRAKGVGPGRAVTLVAGADHPSAGAGPDDAAQAEVRRRRLHLLGHPRSLPVPPAVVRRAEVRAALDHLAWDADLRLTRVVA
jgi:hypothetical protein